MHVPVVRIVFGLAAAALLVAATPPAQPTLLGFSDSSSRTEREWEQKFNAIPQPANMRAAMQRLSARPHHVGSPYDKDNAEWILAQFKSYGLDAHIETFSVLFPTPIDRAVELVSPTHFVAKLQEPALPQDPTSNQRAEALPTYNAYSIDGDVTAPLVYVNYGVPADYEELARHNISVKGAIVIARYGGSWRGIKPKVAAEHGAVGCLIYSDPRDDGYAGGSVFPNGPMRPRDGVQRGSVADMPMYPGDPLTPGVGATKDAKRLPISEAKTITKIPVLPISYGDAQPLLDALGGPLVPAAWRGSLPITYRFGAGPAKVHLKVKSTWTQKPLYDIIATIPGSTEPDQWVIRGNHHDAWVNGAEDPISGLVPELEEARALGTLLKQGWHPKRTIIYAVWDGEEPGLLGSTEWAETHADELRTKGIAYLNSDTNDRGYLSMEGSHVLEKFINGVARDVDDPETHLPVWKRVQAYVIQNGSADERKDARDRADLRIGALGSGSDFTPFLQHLGVPSLNLGFGGEDDAGIYHSIYDDFYWYTHFSDTSFVYGRALAQTVGTAVMRLADAEVLPYDYTNLAETIHTYIGELQKLATSAADEAHERNLRLEEGSFTATNDPRSPTVAPAPLAIPPHISFAALENAADSLMRAAAAYGKAYDNALGSGDAARANASLANVNAILAHSEHVLTDQRGLPMRPWFQHLLYAPGFYTGYGVKTVPAVREAIEQKKYGDVDEAITRVAAVVNAEAALVGSAASALGKGQ
ncbi:MAG: Transferrin receptor domain protein dimerization region [Gemmatimonadetes bacterium]|nr:Transferrin receptor domain protein dimerization region [Gemmatimonadota bacterium]